MTSYDVVSDVCQALIGGVTQQGSVDVTYTVDDCLGNDLIELEDQYDSDGAFVYNRQNCLNVTAGSGGYGSPRHKMSFNSRNTCLKYVEGHLEQFLLGHTSRASSGSPPALTRTSPASLREPWRCRRTRLCTPPAR